MATKESTKSTDEGPAVPLKGFYGLAEHPNHGLISSILKRKARKFEMTKEAKNMCKHVEAYKAAADRLHQALTCMLVENPSLAKHLHEVVRTEPNYRNGGLYLKTYEIVNRKGRKLGTKTESKEIDSVEPVMKVLLALDAEQEKRVRKQVENLKPLTKFIGDDYWEYARLRKVYWDALEAYDDAVTFQNKERSEQAEQATANAQTWRNDCRQKMTDFIEKAIYEQKPKHAECVLKFRDDQIQFHKAMSDLIPWSDMGPDPKQQQPPQKPTDAKSSIKPPK